MYTFNQLTTHTYLIFLLAFCNKIIHTRTHYDGDRQSVGIVYRNNPVCLSIICIKMSWKCNFSLTAGPILMKLCKVTCIYQSWPCIFITDFSYTAWRSQHHITPGSLDPTSLSLLYQDLGISRYLSPNPCTMDNNTHTAMDSSMYYLLFKL